MGIDDFLIQLVKYYRGKTGPCSNFSVAVELDRDLRACLKIKLNYTIVIEFMHLS